MMKISPFRMWIVMSFVAHVNHANPFTAPCGGGYFPCFFDCCKTGEMFCNRHPSEKRCQRCELVKEWCGTPDEHQECTGYCMNLAASLTTPAPKTTTTTTTTGSPPTSPTPANTDVSISNVTKDTIWIAATSPVIGIVILVVFGVGLFLYVKKTAWFKKCRNRQAGTPKPDTASSTTASLSSSDHIQNDQDVGAGHTEQDPLMGNTRSNSSASSESADVAGLGIKTNKSSESIPREAPDVAAPEMKETVRQPQTHQRIQTTMAGREAPGEGNTYVASNTSRPSSQGSSDGGSSQGSPGPNRIGATPARRRGNSTGSASNGSDDSEDNGFDGPAGNQPAPNGGNTSSANCNHCGHQTLTNTINIGVNVQAPGQDVASGHRPDPAATDAFFPDGRPHNPQPQDVNVNGNNNNNINNNNNNNGNNSNNNNPNGGATNANASCDHGRNCQINPTTDGNHQRAAMAIDNDNPAAQYNIFMERQPIQRQQSEHLAEMQPLYGS